MFHKEHSIRNSGDEALIQRVRTHLDEDALDMTKDQIVHYEDGGTYGGTPDPRSLSTQRAWGQFTSQGSKGPRRNSG